MPKSKAQVARAKLRLKIACRYIGSFTSGVLSDIYKYLSLIDLINVAKVFPNFNRPIIIPPEENEAVRVYMPGEYNDRTMYHVHFMEYVVSKGYNLKLIHYVANSAWTCNPLMFVHAMERSNALETNYRKRVIDKLISKQRSFALDSSYETTMNSIKSTIIDELEEPPLWWGFFHNSCNRGSYTCGKVYILTKFHRFYVVYHHTDHDNEENINKEIAIQNSFFQDKSILKVVFRKYLAYCIDDIGRLYTFGNEDVSDGQHIFSSANDVEIFYPYQINQMRHSFVIDCDEWTFVDDNGKLWLSGILNIFALRGTAFYVSRLTNKSFHCSMLSAPTWVHELEGKFIVGAKTIYPVSECDIDTKPIGIKYWTNNGEEEILKFEHTIYPKWSSEWYVYYEDKEEVNQPKWYISIGLNRLVSRKSYMGEKAFNEEAKTKKKKLKNRRKKKKTRDNKIRKKKSEFK